MTQLQAQPDRSLADMRGDVIGRLEALRRRLRLMLAVEGIARTVLGAVVLLLLSLILDHRLELSRPARWVFLLFVVLAVAYMARRFIVMPLRSHMGPLDLSAAIDRRNNGVDCGRLLPLVAAVLELPGMLVNDSATSSAMIHRAVAQSFDTLSGIELLDRADTKHLQKWGAALVGAVILPCVLAILWPNTTSTWAGRWLAGRDTPWPRDTTIVLASADDGVLIVPRGEAVVLRAEVSDRKTPTESVWMRLRHEDGRKESVTLVRFAEGDFRYDLPPMQSPATATLYGGDARLGPIAIEPHDRPRITSMTLNHRAPHDTETHRDDFTGRSDTALFMQADAELQLQTNVPIAGVRVATEQGPALAFQSDDDGRFAAHWTHTEPVQAKLTMQSAESGLSSHPVPIAIGLKQDRPPRVGLRFTGVRQRITNRARIPLESEARDDLGVRSLTLNIEARPVDAASDDETVSDTVALFGPQSPTDEKHAEYPHELDIEAMQRAVGDLLTIEAEAADDHFDSPQVSASRRIVFNIVPDAELFREILLRQQGLRATFRKATEQAQSVEDTLRGDDIDTADASRTFRVLRREVWQVQRDLQASATEMKLNKLGGPEAYDLIERYVIEPMARLHDQDMDRQRQALESLDVDDPAAVADAAERQAQIVDQMNEILSQMRQWDSFIDVVNQLNEVIKLQEGAHEHTDELREEQLESIFDE